MTSQIFICKKCNIFALSPRCPSCDNAAESVQPPKYSPEDKYAHYRREILTLERKAKGLIL